MNTHLRKKAGEDNGDAFLEEVATIAKIVEKTIPALPSPAARVTCFKANLRLIELLRELVEKEPEFFRVRWLEIKQALRKAGDVLDLAQMGVQRQIGKQILAAEAS